MCLRKWSVLLLLSPLILLSPGFVLVNYGYLAFLIVVTIVLYTGATMNRGAQVSPLGLFENVYYGGCS